MVNIIILKLVAIALLILIPLIVCILTLRYNLKSKQNGIMNYFNAFAGGIFLAICILDIYPTALEKFNQKSENLIECLRMKVLNESTFSEEIIEFCEDQNSNAYPYPFLLTIFLYLVLSIAEDWYQAPKPPARSSSSSDIEIPEYPSLSSLKQNQVKPILASQNQQKKKFHSRDLKGKLVVVSIIVHSILEAVALGTMNSVWKVGNLLAAIVVHKWALAFVITQITIYSFETQWIARILIILFILSGGIGAGIGLIFATFGNIAQAFIMAACAGVYLYVAQECLKDNGNQKLKPKLIAISFGVIIIAIVKIFEH